MQNHDRSVNAFNALYRRSRTRTKVSATGGSITAEQARNGNVSVFNTGASAASTWALPAAKKGMKFRAFVMAAQELRLDPNGTETISLANGVQQAAGKYVAADAVGEYATFESFADGTWKLTDFNGTWTVEP